MNPPALLLVGLQFAALAGAVAQENIVVTPRIDAVGAFKNGVATIQVSFRVEKAGVYVWQRPPVAVHGTFWVESDVKVAVRSTARMLPVPEGTLTAPLSLQQELAGKWVSVTLKSAGNAAPVTFEGRVWSPPAPVPPRIWDTNFASLHANPYPWSYDSYGGGPRFSGAPVSPALQGAGAFLILEDERGNQSYVNADSIAALNVKGGVERKAAEQVAPVLEFEVAEAPKQPTSIYVTYLARGLAWVPSYRFEVKDEKTLGIRVGAVVRNELADLRDTEIQLISGYPAMPFAHVDSPLWATGTLATFFSQLNSKGGSGNSVVTQNSITMNGNGVDNLARGAMADDLKEDNATGVDMSFLTIGKHTLAAGDSLSLEVAHQDCTYERVAEWVVPDKRDEYGRYRANRDQNNADEDQPWDGIRFANPFNVPMTTGTAITIESGNFRSQGTSYWMNPGQYATLRTGKALTLKTQVTETEDERARQNVKIGSSQRQQHTMQTALHMQNFRDRAVKVIVRAEFTGDLVSAEGKSETRIRPGGDHQLNIQREIEWTMTVPAHGEQTLQFSHSYLAN